MNGIDRESFITDNIGLVMDIVKRTYPQINKNYLLEFDDVVQIGTIGLIKAYDGFKPEFGTRFSTYAVPMIEGEIKKYLRDNADTIKFPRQIKIDFYKIISFGLIDEEPEVIAEKLDIPLERVQEALEYYKCKSIESLEREIIEDERSPIYLTDKLGEEVDFDTNLELEFFLNQLDKRTREIVELRLKGQTQIEISQKLGISQVHVSRILINLRDKFKKYFGGVDMSLQNLVPNYEKVKQLAIETNLSAEEIHKETGVPVKVAEEYIVAFRGQTITPKKDDKPDYALAKQLAEETDLKAKEIQHQTGVSYITAYNYIKQFRKKKEEPQATENAITLPDNEVVTQDAEQTKEKISVTIAQRLDMPENVVNEVNEIIIPSDGFMTMSFKISLEKVTNHLESIIHAMRVLGFKEVNITLQSEQKA